MPFAGWTSLGQPMPQSVLSHATALNADGRVEAFALAALPEQQAGAILHIWQGAGGEGWSAWAAMVPPLDQPLMPLGAISAGLQKDGLLKMFTPAGSQVQTQQSNGWSNKWQYFFVSAPGSSTTPVQSATPVQVNYYVVVHESDNNMNVFGIPTMYQSPLARTYQTNRYFNNYHGWALVESLASQNPLNLIAEDFDATRNQDDRMEAFVRMSDDCLWHTWQTKLFSQFTDYYKFDNPSADVVLVGRPAAAQKADGRIEVCIRGSDGQLWHIWQTAINNGWSTWSALGGTPIGDPVMGLTAGGQLVVLAQFPDGALWQVSQIGQNGTQGWGSWTSNAAESITHVTLQKTLSGNLLAFISAAGALWFQEITA
jgi:hypothetical protein